MAFKTSGANIVRKTSARASGIAAYAEATNEFVLLGRSVEVQDVSIKKTSVVSGSDLSKTNLGGPAITSLVITDSSYNALDDTAVLPAGGYAKVIGTGFQSGAIVYLNGSALTTTFISSTELRIVIPATSLGTYSLMLFNPDNTGAIYLNLVTSDAPSWITNAGNVAAYIETTTISANVRANTANNDSITYSLVSGSLPSGATLYANGLIAGTAPAVANSTTYSFVINANDTQNQNVTRSFSMTINTDVVTWSSPADGTVYTIANSTAISNVTLAATNLAGGNIVYTANTLPGGVSLTNNVLFGTPANAYATSTLLTANATTTGRTSTRTIHWSIQLPNDEFFKYVTTLLSASNSANTFVKDSSINSANVVISGDTKPFNFNPYNPTGYYGVNFTAKTDYISIPATTALTTFTGDFTFEAWIYPTDTSITYWKIWDSRQAGATGQPMVIGLDPLASPVTGQGRLSYFNGSSSYGTGIVYYNRWTHIAFVRSGSTMTFYVDGVAGGTATVSGTQTGSATTNPVWIGTKDNGLSSYGSTGYISNFRIVNGTAVYTSNFTPSTSPLTAITNTVLLACQDNRYKDNSTNNYTLTPSSTTAISGLIPYTPSSSYSTYGSTYFDGTGDYLSWSGTSIAGDFTAEAWVYPTANDASGYCVLYGSSAANNQLYYNASTGAVGLVLNATTVISATGTAVKLNAWNHIAFVRSGSACTIYVNGVSTATGTSSATFNLAFLGTYAYTTPSGYEVNGYVTDARIVNGTAVYTGAFTPPTTPLTAVANTSLLTCQGNQPVNNNVFIDNSTNNLSITRNGNTTLGTFSPYGAGFSNYFDGTGDYLQTPANGAFQLTGDFTVEAWVYITTLNSYNMVFGSANATGPDYFAIRSNNTLELAIANASYPAWSFTWALNTWYHVAVTRSGSTLRAFVNGNALTLSSGSATNSSQYFQTGDGIQIGRWGLGSPIYYFTGYISNARIVKGTAVYTSAFTPSTTPLQSIANTSLLTCQSPSFVDNSANNFTITRNGDTSVQKFSPFPATTLPTPYYGASFNGSSDYLSTSNNAAFNFGTSDFTVELWANHSSVSQIQTMVSNYTGASNGWGFQWRSDNTRLNFFLGDTSLIFYTFTPTVGVWYHYAVSRSGTSMRLFINGAVVATVTDSTNLTSSGSTYIGNINNAISQYTLGYLSNVRVVKGQALYTGAFTPSTTPLTTTSQGATASNVSLLTCQSNTFIDNSINNFTLTAVSTTVKPTTFSPFTVSYSTGQSYTPAVFGGSMYFDGTGDYLTIAANSAFYLSTGNWTIEAWIYKRTTGKQIIVSQTQNNASPYSGWLLYISATESLTFEGNNGSLIGSPSVTVPLNSWTHVAAVKSGTTLTLYQNGVSVNSGTVPAITDYSTVLAIGTYSSYVSAGDWNGFISDLRITKGQALYNSNFVPGNAPLQAVRNTVLLLNGTSDSISDASSMVNFETVGDTKVNNLGPYSGNYYSNYFDGTGDYISNSTDNAALRMGSGDFTIEFWMYCPTTSSALVIYDNRINTTNNTGGLNLYHQSGTISLYGGATTNTLLVSGTVTYNAWNHVAIVRNGSGTGNVKMYINGALVSTYGSADTNDYVQGYLNIGCYLLGGTASNFYTGYISNFRMVKGTAVYTGAFTPSTTPLTAIANTSLLTCQSNKFVDNSTNAFTITRNGDTRVATQNPFRNNSDYSIYFDGTGDWLISPPSAVNQLGTGNFTVEFWVYSTTAATQGFFNISATSSSGSAGLAIVKTASNTFTFWVNGNGGQAATTTTYGLNTWHHVALVRNGSTNTLYVNGVSGVTNTATPTWASTPCIGVGRTYNDNTIEAFIGYICDLRITKGVARYTTTFTPPTTPFLGK